jgi:hypothetical protein
MVNLQNHCNSSTVCLQTPGEDWLVLPRFSIKPREMGSFVRHVPIREVQPQVT